MQVIAEFVFPLYTRGDCNIHITNNKYNLVISHYKENKSKSESDDTIFIDKDLDKDYKYSDFRNIERVSNKTIKCIKDVHSGDKIKIYVDIKDKVSVLSVMDSCSIHYTYKHRKHLKKWVTVEIK
jgi:hypothetical protein